MTTALRRTLMMALALVAIVGLATDPDTCRPQPHRRGVRRTKWLPIGAGETP